VSGALHRFVAAFVAPVERDASLGTWLEPEPPAPATVAILAPPGRALAAGGAVALAVAKGVAVVAVWGGRDAGAARAPAQPRARRVATKLAGRGHDAVATGRLVVVALDGPDEAARVAAAADVPTVLVVAGPRDAQVDRVLRDHDRVLVCGDDLVADLAAESVRALGVRAGAVALPAAAAARLLAATGVALVAPWRAHVEAALG
jgi:hypothetical protein